MSKQLLSTPTGPRLVARVPAPAPRTLCLPRSGRWLLGRCAAASSLDPNPSTSSPRPGTPVAAVAAAEPQTQQQPDVPVVDIEEPVPVDVLAEFEHKLEADLKTVGVTLTAVTGVIIFWRGVWSLLDWFLEDSLFGDICCIIVGLTVVLWIRLTGVKVSPTFWPPS